MLLINGKEITDSENGWKFRVINTKIVTRLHLASHLDPFEIGCGGFEDIQEIVLRNNLFSSFEIGGEEFRNLYYIYLENNRLTSFVINGSFWNLSTLNLSSNKLVSFEARGVLPNLRILNLENNKLTSFVSGDKFPNLHALRLGNNQIALFEAECPQLEYLYLENNQLTSFETGNLTNLRDLHLYGNYLTLFRVSGRLPEIRTIFLDYNQLTSFGASYVDLPKLSLLNLSDNPNLETIDFQSNGVEDLDIKLRNTNVSFVDPSIASCVRGKVF